MARKSQSGKGGNAVRIIAGEWRGRRLTFPGVAAVRPTPDRVRETLFNWLADKLPGARCLDLFAGTGVLGFEALSRGAEEVWFVEREPLLVRTLHHHIELLDARAAIHSGDVQAFLSTPAKDRFDVVFLDPPYQCPLSTVVELLPPWLKPRALVYIERPSREGLASADTLGRLWRESRAGQVSYGLISVE